MSGSPYRALFERILVFTKNSPNIPVRRSLGLAAEFATLKVGGDILPSVKASKPAELLCMQPG